jgi:hypothetical protein
MRPGEYLGLRWADVDLERGRVVVQRAVAWQAGAWSFTEPKTPRSRRSIPLPPSVVRLLREHRRQQAAERLAAGHRYQHLDLVFATETGTPIDLRNLAQRHFKAVLKAAGLPPTIRLYDLRHTSATLLLAAGEHPKVVSERLGHATILLTLDTYSHVLPTMQQGAAERLERALFAGAGRWDAASALSATCDANQHPPSGGTHAGLRQESIRDRAAHQPGSDGVGRVARLDGNDPDLTSGGSTSDQRHGGGEQW